MHCSNMDDHIKGAIKATIVEQNAFFDHFFQTKKVLEHIQKGQLCFRIPIIGRLITILDCPSKKTIAKTVLLQRGWVGNFEQYKMKKGFQQDVMYWANRVNGYTDIQFIQDILLSYDQKEGSSRTRLECCSPLTNTVLVMHVKIVAKDIKSEFVKPF